MKHSIPKVTFGIVFDSSKVSNAALDLGVDSQVTISANAAVGSTTNFYYCIGATGKTKLFGNIDAPTVFGYPLSRYYALYDKGPYEVYKKTRSNDAAQ